MSTLFQWNAVIGKQMVKWRNLSWMKPSLIVHEKIVLDCVMHNRLSSETSNATWS